MKKFTKVAAIAALSAASLSASAWWGGPFGNTAYGYHAPSWAYPYYGDGYAPATAPVNAEEAQKAAAEQQKAMQEAAQKMAAQQAEAYKQAVEAQRKVAEQYAEQFGKVQPHVYADPLVNAHQDLMQRIVEDQVDAQKRFVEVNQEAHERMVKDQARFWEEVRTPVTPFANREDLYKDAEARRAEIEKEMEARRAEMEKDMEARRSDLFVGRRNI